MLVSKLITRVFAGITAPIEELVIIDPATGPFCQKTTLPKPLGLTSISLPAIMPPTTSALPVFWVKVALGLALTL